jgi:hypothetical protein
VIEIQYYSKKINIFILIIYKYQLFINNIWNKNKNGILKIVCGKSVTRYNNPPLISNTRLDRVRSMVPTISTDYYTKEAHVRMISRRHIHCVNDITRKLGGSAPIWTRKGPPRSLIYPRKERSRGRYRSLRASCSGSGSGSAAPRWRSRRCDFSKLPVRLRSQTVSSRIHWSQRTGGAG